MLRGETVMRLHCEVITNVNAFFHPRFKRIVTMGRAEFAEQFGCPDVRGASAAIPGRTIPGPYSHCWCTPIRGGCWRSVRRSGT